jgi:hypothetical protein
MVSCTRPLLLGYIRAHLSMTADEIDAARSSLAAFALAEGFALGTVYLEHPQTAPAAFEALVDAVRRDNDVWAVAVPTEHHVTNGGLRAMRRDLEHHGAVHLMVAAPPPSPADLACPETPARRQVRRSAPPPPNSAVWTLLPNGT